MPRGVEVATLVEGAFLFEEDNWRALHQRGRVGGGTAKLSGRGVSGVIAERRFADADADADADTYADADADAVATRE